MNAWTNKLRDHIDAAYDDQQIEWDELWITIAQLAAVRSRCSRDRVGAVLVSRDNVQLSLGYNGAPSSYELDDGRWCVNWCQRAKLHQRGEAAGRSYDDCPANHAEVNTLLRAPKQHGLCTIYVSTMPCVSCAKFIAACYPTHGVTEVVVSIGGVGDAYRDTKASISIMEGCGINVRTWPGSTDTPTLVR